MNRNLKRLLTEMVNRDASDLFITVGAPPSIKVHGRLVQAGTVALDEHHVRAFLASVMPGHMAKEFEDSRESNFAFAPPGMPRFRANAFFQRNTPGMVIRQIRSDIPTLTSLGLPEVMGDLALAKRGIVFVVGATGSGKSTSLASLIHQRNTQGSGHIITIEDPIEFLHRHHQCVVTQREVGVDTSSFEVALENTLRQAPDCVVIGEIRSREAMQQAITFAETGHLCLATLHANTAAQAIERVLHFFPNPEHDRVRLDLANNLAGVLGQQLLPKASQPGLALATEVLINTPLIAEKIRSNRLSEIRMQMTRGVNQGMHTFDQSLFWLYREGQIDYDAALGHAESPNDLRLQIKLSQGNSGEHKSELDQARVLEF